MEPGDTLYSVSREQNVPLERLMELNDIDDAKLVPVGTRLQLLTGSGGGLRPVTQKVTRSSQPFVPNMSSSEQSMEPFAVFTQQGAVSNGKVDQIVTPSSRPSVPVTYVVVKGDTLYSIGARFNLDISELISINGIKNPRSLSPGTVLTIAGDRSPRVGMDGVPLWPTAGKREPLTGKLDGVAISGDPGQPVHSVSTGTVTWSGPRRGYGYVVLVRNEMGYIYGYLGNERVLVQAGDRVEIGSQIGRLGVNPYDETAQLYFVVWKDGHFVNPGSAPRA
jgi:LysM repeat protein